MTYLSFVLEEKMKKWPLLLIWGLLLLWTTATAQPSCRRVIVDVWLSAKYLTVTELRIVSPNGADEMTIPIAGKNQMKKFIMNVSYFKDKENFERLDWWNSSAPAAEKQRKCGRKWVDAYNSEMCWGLDPDRQRIYLVSYPLVNVLYADEAKDVLDYDFVRPSSLSADTMEVRLHAGQENPLTESDVDFSQSSADGEISMKDGVVYIRPKGRKTGGLHVHLAFRPGLFPGLPGKSSAGTSGEDGKDLVEETEGMLEAGASRLFPGFSQEELQSPMMRDDRKKSESGGLAIVEYFSAYPKTFIFVGCVVFVLGAVIFRKIKAMML